MISLLELELIMARGLGAELAWELRRHAAANGESLRGLRAAHRRGVRWAAPGAAQRLQARAQAADLALAWRGDVEYPLKLMRRMGETAPAWVWLAGSRARLVGPACAMVGSRYQAPPAFLRAAHRLAQALAAEGVTVVSGLAIGSDLSAHEGAMRGQAGTLAIPARGLLASGACMPAPTGMTLLGLDSPEAPFSAGLAVRRNALIPALAEALILIASDLKGGSAHAVHWALKRGLPLFTFVSRRGTPAGNLSLARGGRASALNLDEGEDLWMDAILPVIHSNRAWQHFEASRARSSQPSFLADSPACER